MPIRRDRLAVAVLAREVDAARNARQPLDHRAADQARVPGRAAGHELGAREFAHPGRVEVDAVEVDVAIDFQHARADRVADRARLLEDLLLHEAVVAALLRLNGVPLHELLLARDRGSVEGLDRDGVGSDSRHRAVVQDLDVARVREERRDVARDEVLALAVADDDRVAAVLRDQDLARRRLVDHRDRARALEPAERAAHRLLQRRAALARLVDQVRDDLGVGVALEHAAVGFERGAQRAEVLDDAVADHRDAAGHVRVRVALGGFPVSRPAGVSDADRAGQRHLAQHALEVHELPLSANHAQLAVYEHRYAGRVVAAVLEAPQAVEDHVLRAVTVSDVADDSTHFLSYSSTFACAKSGGPSWLTLTLTDRAAFRWSRGHPTHAPALAGSARGGPRLATASELLIVVAALEPAFAPALDVALLRARDSERAAGDGLGDGRPRAHVGIGLDGARSDQIRFAADERAVADAGSRFLLAVVVHHDRAAAEGDLLADVCVADVAQVVGLRALAHHGILHLDVVADAHVLAQIGAGAEVRVRADDTAVADPGALEAAARLDPDVVADDRVFDHHARLDAAARADAHALAQHDAGREHGVLADLDVDLHVGRLGIEQRHALAHQLVDEPLAHQRLRARELRLGVDAE